MELSALNLVCAILSIIYVMLHPNSAIFFFCYFSVSFTFNNSRMQNLGVGVVSIDLFKVDSTRSNFFTPTYSTEVARTRV